MAEANVGGDGDEVGAAVVLACRHAMLGFSDRASPKKRVVLPDRPDP